MLNASVIITFIITWVTINIADILLNAIRILPQNIMQCNLAKYLHELEIMI